MKVEIWSDVVCPWCYIGKRRFERGLAAFRQENPDVEIEVAYRSYQLDPTAPGGRAEPVVAAYEKKFGGPTQAAEIIDRVTSEAAGEGLAFRMDIAQRANTQMAHRLLVLAEREGVQHEMKERLMRAYFSEGESVGVLETLVRLATEVGLDGEMVGEWLAGNAGKAEVLSHFEFAMQANITSVPTFVFDRQAGVAGAQPAEVFTQILAELYTRA
ncbi:MAG: DsbA family oxidoreductase [Actinomycetota bacterium]|nr:DsbA family oxidoreductase [Actinomycetota bacterium]